MPETMTLKEYQEQYLKPLCIGAMLYVTDKIHNTKHIAILAAIPNNDFVRKYGLVCIDDGCYWRSTITEHQPTICELQKKMKNIYKIELIYDNTIKDALHKILGINSK